MNEPNLATTPKQLMFIHLLASAARVVAVSAAVVAGTTFTVLAQTGRGPTPAPASPETRPAGAASHQEVINRYCVTCHNDRLVNGALGDSADAPASALVAQLRAADIALDMLDVGDVAAHPAEWERVVRKLRAGVMPPAGRPRPDEKTQDALVAWLEAELDQAQRSNPDPGRTATFHRLNRAEYRNAVRDLLALDLDIVDFLPADDSSFGFDNIGGVLRMSDSLLERYLGAAKTIARMAVGSPPPTPQSEVYRNAQDLQQHDRIEGLPFGTRGGMSAIHFFPQDAEYEVSIVLTRARGREEPHPLEVTVDGERVQLFGGEDARSTTFEVRTPVSAGPHEVVVAFHRNPRSLVEQVREPFQNPRVSGNSGGPGGSIPFVSSVTIAGPFAPTGPGATPSRDRVFLCRPASATRADEIACARSIVSSLARRAYRGQVAPDDVDVLFSFYEAARDAGAGFEDGIELALRRLLVSPQFLFRISIPPAGRDADAAVGVPYALDDVALASRLSFFLWSSIPDEELLEVAGRGGLRDPVERDRQVARMLRDHRSEALTANFAGQWLQLRNLATAIRPGDPFSLAFGEALRQGLLRETELFFDSVIREDRSVVELLTADYTFLNERVAEHYGISNIQGSHFRRVRLPADSPRRGLLGHGSILTLTSHAIRTSPVLRGKWVLDNVLGTPPPEPPPNVPALPDKKTQAKVATMRDRMAAHRTNPTCAACHRLIDPAGFALENFDAIGRWRLVDESYNPIDATGALPDGTRFDGVSELRAALVRRPERFVTTVTEKLLTYALGRGLEHYDMPAVRTIIKDSANDQYRFQSLIRGVVNSYPFLNRR